MKRCIHWIYLLVCCLYSLTGTAQCPLPAPKIRLTQPNTTSIAFGSFCQGEQVQLNAVTTQAGVRYQWKRDGNNVAGATNPALVVGQGGIYTVQIESAACPAAVSSEPVTITPENCTPTGRVRIRGGSLEEDVNSNLFIAQYASIRITLFSYLSDRSRFPLQVPGYIYRKRDNSLLRTVQFQRSSRIESVWKRAPACNNDSTLLQDIYYFYDMRNEPATFSDPEGYIITTAPICCREATSNLPGETPVVFYMEFAAHRSYNLILPQSTFAPEYYVPARLEVCAGKPLSFGSTIQPSANLTTFRYTFTDIYTDQAAAPRYMALPMQPGYSPTNVTGNTANGLVINPQSGIISGTPERPGLYVYSVRGEFFQAGVRMGEILREIQLEVRDCDNAKPVVGVSALANPSKPVEPRICPGVTLQLNATGLSAGGQLQWQRDGQPITGATSSTLAVQQAGTYTLTAIKKDACPPLVISDAISVSSTTAAVSLSVSAAGLCPDQPIQLSASTTAAGATYSWFRDDGLLPLATSQTYSATVAGSYRVQLTDALGCTATSASLPVSNTAIAAGVSISREQDSNARLCRGAGLYLRATASVPVLRYEWLLANTVVTNATSASLIPSQSGRYTVRITTANGCTAVSPALSVPPPDEPPTVTLAGSASVLCAGNVATLRVLDDASLTYQWQRDGQPVSGATSFSYTASQSGSYAVVLRDRSDCSVVSSTWPLAISLPPTVQISGNKEVCSNATTPLTASSPSVGASYQWFLDGTLLPVVTSATLEARTAGTYQVRLTDPIGCTASSASWPLIVIDQIRVELLPVGPVCADAPTVLLSGSPAGGTFSGPGVTGNQFTPTAAGVGQHTLTYAIDGLTTCQRGTAQQSVTVQPLPVVRSVPVIYLNQGGSVRLDGPVGTGYQYSWEPPTGLSDPMIRDPQASPVVNTTYVLRVRDDLGCEGMGTFVVQVDRRLYVPDAFTPNGDGLNETWQLFGAAAFPDMEVTIFNRWGSVVFYSKGYQQPFSGTTDSNQALPDGLYTYLIRLDTTQQMRGTVLLAR